MVLFFQILDQPFEFDQRTRVLAQAELSVTAPSFHIELDSFPVDLGCPCVTSNHGPNSSAADVLDLDVGPDGFLPRFEIRAQGLARCTLHQHNHVGGGKDGRPRISTERYDHRAIDVPYQFADRSDLKSWFHTQRSGIYSIRFKLDSNPSGRHGYGRHAHDLGMQGSFCPREPKRKPSGRESLLSSIC